MTLEEAMNLTPDQLEVLARELYETNANRVKPSWDEIGEYTKQVWRDYAIDGIKPLDVLVSEDTLEAALDDATGPDWENP